MANATGTVSRKAAKVTADTAMDLVDEIVDGDAVQALMLTLFVANFIASLRQAGVSLSHVDD
jgi:hypothetical protein